MNTKSASGSGIGSGIGSGVLGVRGVMGEFGGGLG